LVVFPQIAKIADMAGRSQGMKTSESTTFRKLLRRGFGYGTGHDYACRYVGADVSMLGEGSESTILVPEGGLPPSNSFF
jgi:hypothetical protein